MKREVPEGRNDGAACYWRVRTWLELIKTGVWIILQSTRPGGPFDL